jgi:hypothetical protein
MSFKFAYQLERKGLVENLEMGASNFGLSEKTVEVSRLRLNNQ